VLERRRSGVEQIDDLIYASHSDMILALSFPAPSRARIFSLKSRADAIRFAPSKNYRIEKRLARLSDPETLVDQHDLVTEPSRNISHMHSNAPVSSLNFDRLGLL
jgi:hypothetical protein